MQSTIFHSSAIAALGLAASIALAPTAFAEVQTYTAELKGASEVPPTDSKGAGVVDATYDTTTKVFNYNITYSGMTGPATAAHFHGPGAVGENAGVVVPMKDPKSPIHGTTTITSQQASELQAGKWYFNVHTAAHPQGEIRGQLIMKKK